MPIQLHRETVGAGPPVVCLHGFGATSYTWRELRSSLTAHTLHTLDLKGHGHSPKPEDGRYTVHDQATLVVAYIDELRLTGVTLVGHSFGGAVALVTALELLRSRPAALKSLILLDAACYRQPLPEFIRVLQLPVVGPLLQRLVPARSQVRRVLCHAYFDDSLIADATIEAYAAPLRAPGGPYALRETAKQIVPADIDAICARYPTIAVPTLLVWGAHDEIVPLTFGERLRQAIPDSRLVVIDDAGHMPHEETPAPVRAAVEEFLSGT